jgi:hypothetical protein
MAINVKPANLITTNKVVSVSQVVTDLNKNIPKNSTDPVKTYLQLLVKMYASPSKTIEKQIKDHYAANKREINAEMSAIKNDFGEILGGIATVNESLLSKFYSGVKFNSGKLEYPTAQNEPLKDYSVFVGKTEYVISAKIAGATSNTVKPQDIMGLIDRSSHIPAARKKVLKATLEYKILEILGKENTVKGAIKALSYVCNNIKDPKKKAELRKIVDLNSFPTSGAVDIDLTTINSKINTSKKTSDPYNGKAFKNLLKSKQFVAYSSTRGVGKPLTWADVVLFSEYCLEKISRAKILDFGQLFLDAITSQVHYVKLSIDGTTGIPKFEAYASVNTGKKTISNMDAAGIFMRSKSSMYKDGRYRLKDKMGIQT